ncbi:hypothetical protein ACE1OE_02740 [Vibrio sp. E150_011]
MCSLPISLSYQGLQNGQSTLIVTISKRVFDTGGALDRFQFVLHHFGINGLDINATGVQSSIFRQQ